MPLPHYIFVVLTAMLFVQDATAKITYTLAMNQAERFCGVAISSYPTTGAGAQCSLTSPRWYSIHGLGLIAYAVDMDGYTVTSVPIPDLSSGTVELVAGLMDCPNRGACMGNAVGSFASTRFATPHGI
eukprot:PhM_4_TR1328/c0_g1_i5/m.100982